MVYRDRAVINRRGFISSWLGIDTNIKDDDEENEQASVNARSIARDAEYEEDAASFVTCADCCSLHDDGSGPVDVCGSSIGSIGSIGGSSRTLDAILTTLWRFTRWLTTTKPCVSIDVMF
jgi:hypothetical protein